MITPGSMARSLRSPQRIGLIAVFPSDLAHHCHEMIHESTVTTNKGGFEMEVDVYSTQPRRESQYPLIMTNSLLLKMAIEIMNLVIFHRVRLPAGNHQENGLKMTVTTWHG